jgi:hypothetical protein
MNPIEKAVRPLKVTAMERAEQEALAEIEKARAELEKHGWNINKAAPYPRQTGAGALYGVAYYAARSRYNLFHALTTQDPAKGYQVSNGRDPLMVVIDDERAARYVAKRREWAGEDYDAFVAKLVAKVGEAKKAVLHGNHVWDTSTLIVTKPDGTTEAWSTKQIVNHSKLGKPFNQWPTRKLKQVPNLKAAA